MSEVYMLAAAISRLSSAQQKALIQWVAEICRMQAQGVPTDEIVAYARRVALTVIFAPNDDTGDPREPLDSFLPGKNIALN